MPYEQLNLFSWDFDIMGEGHSALMQLDFKYARKVFEEILENTHEHQEAQQGLTLCDDWQSLFEKNKRLEQVIACEFLWQAMSTYDFDENSIALSLKKSFLKMLAREIEQFDVHLYSDSGLCLGQMLLELEEISKAIDAFDPLLEYYPHDPYLLVHYGNTLWHSEDKTKAKINYIKALLIAPSMILPLPIKDQEMENLIKNEGPYMAPIYEWIKHRMPVLDIPTIKGEDLEHVGALAVYYMLKRVNEMRTSGNLEQMTLLGLELQTQAPEVFETYMENIQPA